MVLGRSQIWLALLAVVGDAASEIKQAIFDHPDASP
jgi:hypothetical protein